MSEQHKLINSGKVSAAAASSLFPRKHAVFPISPLKLSGVSEGKQWPAAPEGSALVSVSTARTRRPAGIRNQRWEFHCWWLINSRQDEYKVSRSSWVNTVVFFFPSLPHDLISFVKLMWSHKLQVLEGKNSLIVTDGNLFNWSCPAFHQ